MAKYASDTTVSSESSLAEIKRIVMRYGAGGFGYMENEEAAVVMFDCEGRRVRFVIPLPDRKSRVFTHTPGRQIVRSKEEAAKAYEQAIRQRWRALALVIKAKLEAVEANITTFETEFLAHIVLPNGQTVAEWAAPQIASAYETGSMPPLLPMATGGRGK